MTTDQNKPKPKRRKRRSKNKKHYFTQDHEDAIIRYCQTTCVRERTELYVKWIEPAFNEMVDKIVFTYKFTNLPNIDSLRDECKTNMIPQRALRHSHIFLLLRKTGSFTKWSASNARIKQRLILTTWPRIMKSNTCQQQSHTSQNAKRQSFGICSIRN